MKKETALKIVGGRDVGSTGGGGTDLGYPAPQDEIDCWCEEAGYDGGWNSEEGKCDGPYHDPYQDKSEEKPEREPEEEPEAPKEEEKCYE